MLQHYLKIAFRQLLKNKVQYILSILGIALGLLCFSMVDYYLQKAYVSDYEGWPNQNRLARLWSEKDGHWGWVESIDELQQFINNPVIGIEKISFNQSDWYEGGIIFKEQQKVQEFLGLPVNRINMDFIDVHGLKNSNGENLNISSGGVLVSERFAKNFIGEENPVGMRVQLGMRENDSSPLVYENYTITDVIKDPALKNFTLMDVYRLTPTPVYKESEYSKDALLLLAKGVDSKEINERIKEQFPSFGEDGRRVFIQTYSDIIANRDTLMIKSIFLFFGSLILISAMINFLKFSIQTFLIRTRELSLRKGLGAKNIQLFALLFAEIAIVLLFTLLISTLVTKSFLLFYHDYLPSQMLDDLQIDEWKLFFVQAKNLFFLLVISGIVCWLAILRVKNLGIISGINGAGKGKHGIRNFFLGFQLVVCFFFTGVSVIVFSLYVEDMKSRNMTLSVEEREHIWLLELFKRRPLFQGHEQEIYSKINALSDVEDILVAYRHNEKILFSDGREFEVEVWSASENYPEFMNFQLNGRMPRNNHEAIFSQKLMEALEKDNPEDSYTVKIGETFLPVIGTYELLPFESSGSALEPPRDRYNMITGLQEGLVFDNFWVKSRKGKKNEVKESIQHILSEYTGPTSFEPISMREEHRMRFEGMEITRDLFLILSIVSLLIMALGIYSAITLDTRSRRKEVAIRKINGANRWVIARLFAKLYIRLLIISAVIALPMMIWLSSSEILPLGFSPLLYGLVIIIVSGTVALSVFGHIRQIMKVNPADIIKSE